MNLRDEINSKYKESLCPDILPERKEMTKETFPSEIRLEMVERTLDLFREYFKYALRFPDSNEDTLIDSSTGKRRVRKYIDIEYPHIMCLKQGEVLEDSPKTWPYIRNTGEGAIELVDCKCSIYHSSDDTYFPPTKSIIFSAKETEVTKACLSRMEIDRSTLEYSSGCCQIRDPKKYQLVLTNIRDKELDMLNKLLGQWLRDNYVAEWDCKRIKRLFGNDEWIRQFKLVEADSFKIEGHFSLCIILD